MPTSYISRIVNGYSDIDMEDHIGQPALAGTDNESAEHLLDVEGLYREVDTARRRRPQPKAQPAMARPIVFDMEAILIAKADGEVPLTEDEFVAFCAGLAAEPF